jgi:tRNA (adenine57-N1/adenine58-N1)-methyltransferase catalytic subunit
MQVSPVRPHSRNVGCTTILIDDGIACVGARSPAATVDITMYETLLRPHEVSQAPRLARIGSVTEKLKQQERNREAKRQRQIAASRARHRRPQVTTEKRKRQDDDDDNSAGVAEADSDPGCSELEAKKAKTTRTTKMLKGDDDTCVPDVAMDMIEELPEENGQPENEPSAPAILADDPTPPPLLSTAPTPPPAPAATPVLSRQSKEVRGHTSFLTFACLLPLQPPQS